MSNVKNKVILITGASSGIGEACAKHFAQVGANVIIAARRVERLEKLATQLSTEYGINVLPIELDVTDKVGVKQTLTNLPEEWRDVDVLVNNAGLGRTTDKLQDGNPDDWDLMIDTNVKGLLYVTRAIVTNMVKRQTGMVINISSIAGLGHYGGGNVYSPTKHAVNAISNVLRVDLLGTGVRVTTVNPGMVKTEFSEVRWNDKARADEYYNTFKALNADDIARSVVFCAEQPAHTTISDITVVPSIQADINHIYSEVGTGTPFNQK